MGLLQLDIFINVLKGVASSLSKVSNSVLQAFKLLLDYLKIIQIISKII